MSADDSTAWRLRDKHLQEAKDVILSAPPSSYHPKHTPMPSPIVTADDLAALIALAEFIEALEIESDAPEHLRGLVERLSSLVILPNA